MFRRYVGKRLEQVSARRAGRWGIAHVGAVPGRYEGWRVAR